MVPTQNRLGHVEMNTLIAGDPPIWSSSWFQPSWSPYYCPVNVSDPARPIKLTMAEVMRLRFFAQEHPELKVILQKFTAQIEILVQFD